MPDWLEESAWWVVILATAVASAVATVLVQRAPPVVFRWVRNGLCRVNHWRKFVIGTKRTRAGVLSGWRKAPLRVLRATVFRWFAADPQAWCGYLRGVYESHTGEAVRERASGLLWVDKTVADLQVGDIYGQGRHVLALIPDGETIEVVTDCSFVGADYGGGSEIKPVTHQVRVNRGWCPSGDACPYCSMNDQTFRAFTEKVQAVWCLW